jgi:hypothetical protein
MFANMKREERDVRANIGSDQCMVDQEWFFIRGCLEIPVLDSNEPFLCGLWATVHERAYDEISESWQEAGREKIRGPYKGRLANSLSVYAGTLNLKVTILVQPVGTRPSFLIDEREHPLAVEQQTGISKARASELVALLLHQEKMGFPSNLP